MGETKLSNNDFTDGNIIPYVFKNIDSSDVSVTPFSINKTWTVVSGSTTSSCLPLNAIYWDTNVLPALGSISTDNDPKNVDGSLQTIIYYSINKLFFKNKQNNYVTLGPNNPYFYKNLYVSASILSFPYVKIGEGIKTKSFNLQSTSGSLNFNLKSDEYGNVYDLQLNTSSIIPGTVFYEGFNTYFNTINLANSVDGMSYPYMINDRYITGSVSFTNGVTATSGQQKSIGYCAQFDRSGYMVVPNTTVPGLYDRDHNYAISFFISASNSYSNIQYLINKQTSRSPYNILLLPNKRIQFMVVGDVYKEQDDGVYNNIQNISISSSTAVSSSWNHIVCQKSGSSLQLYVNGTLESSINSPLLKKPNSPLSSSIRIDSTSDILIGGRSLKNTTSCYAGKLDEIRIYNKSLTSTQINYLKDRNETGSMLQTRIVGNVYDKQGLVIISSPNYIYNNLLQTPYTASYKSTLTRYELSTIVRINSDEFNSSLNSSLLEHDGQTYRNFVSSSIFNPYITTIGLYDSNAQLLAIGKLAKPFKKRDDVDTNILIRLDLDMNIKSK